MVVFLALDLDGSDESTELDADEVLGGAGDPFRTRERRGGGAAFAVLAMTGGADEVLLPSQFHHGGVDAVHGGDLECGGVNWGGREGGFDGFFTAGEAAEPGDEIADFTWLKEVSHGGHG